MLPALQQCKNHPTEPKEQLILAGWPELFNNGTDHAVDPALSALFTYLKHNKHEFQKHYDAACSGGKKGKKNKGPQLEKNVDTCTIFVGDEFPAFQKKVLDILKTCPYDKRERIIKGDYI